MRARSILGATLAVGLVLTSPVARAEPPTAESSFRVALPPHRFTDKLLPDSPFGINTAFRPDAPDLEDRLRAMQEAGIKWGRQDFTWKRIETKKGEYDWGPYDRLVEACRKRGVWWTLKDGGTRQFDMADMVGLTRADLAPKYAYYAYGWMARMLEGRRWERNDALGPDVYAVVFRDPDGGPDLVVAWSPKPYAYMRVNNDKGLNIYDVFGTRRTVPVDPVRTKYLTIPLGESPVYVTGARGLKATVRPDPGW